MSRNTETEQPSELSRLGQSVEFQFSLTTETRPHDRATAGFSRPGPPPECDGKTDSFAPHRNKLHHTSCLCCMTLYCNSRNVFKNEKQVEEI